MDAERRGSKERQTPFFRIGVLGALGSGKSTVIEVIANNFQDAVIVEEKFRKNPHLAKFYRDPSRWSFPCQTQFLIDKVDQCSMLPKKGIQFIVPSVDMDRLYAWTHRQMDWMTEAEWKLYQWLYQSLTKAKKISLPDAYIAITTDDDVLLRRIKNRASQPGRKAERWILKNYPEYPIKLARNVNKWIVKRARSRPVLVIDTSIYDCITSEGKVQVARISNNFIRGVVSKKAVLPS